MTLLALYQIVKQNKAVAAVLATLCLLVLIVTFGLVQQSCQRRSDENENKRLKQIEQNANAHQQAADNARDNRIFEGGEADEKVREAANNNAELKRAEIQANGALSNLEKVRNGHYRGTTANELQEKAGNY